MKLVRVEKYNRVTRQSYLEVHININGIDEYFGTARSVPERLALIAKANQWIENNKSRK